MILRNFGECLKDETIYKPEQIEDVIKQVRTNFRFHKVNTPHKYFNVPCSFDIETSSFYDQNMEKVGLMYVWIFGIYGKVIIGRTWNEFTGMIEKLCNILDLNSDKRLCCFCHNLQYDFQFFRSHFHFEKVFASDRRQPLYALTDSGIEFRCSYMLSGLSLQKVGENLLKYKVSKMVGDLDYRQIRHAKTPLSKKEVGYCSGDVKVVMAYIAEEIENYEGIGNLPYTKTGYVRKYCRNYTFYDPETGRRDKERFYRNKELMRACCILDPSMYDDLKNAFMGGYTHANDLYVKKSIGTDKSCEIKGKIASWDFTSSYPAVLLSERMPMGKPERIDCTELTSDKFEYLNRMYCTMFTISFENIREKPDAPDTYISQSKCILLSKDAVINNGRVVSAAELEITILNIDYEIIDQLYDWDSYTVGNMYIWIKDYLPRDFMLAILNLYKNKTELKGVKDKQAEYMVSKAMLNACY